MRHQQGNRIRRNDRVRVDAHKQLFGDKLQAVIQRVCLARVVLGQQSDLAGREFPREFTAHYVNRRVLRPIIDHDCAQVRVIRVEYATQGAFNHHFFVVCRNQHGHRWLIVRV